MINYVWLYLAIVYGQMFALFMQFFMSDCLIQFFLKIFLQYKKKITFLNK
jgi:hypothetical protein